MKYFKIFMLMMATVAFAACSSDDDGWNGSGDAVVSMANQEITWKENKGSSTPVYVPITVTGERNGNVQVTVQVKETGENPAMDDIHYIITSKTVVIPADATQGKIELRTVDDNDINENRTFTMTIVDAKGATISSTNASTLITLKDNDSEFYEKLMGKWTLTGVNWTGQTAYSWNVTIEGYEEGEEGYNKDLWISGMMGYDWAYADLEYHFDTTTKQGHVDFVFPSLCAEEVDFGLGGYNDVMLYRRNGNSLDTEPIVGHWNDDFTEVTFESDPAVYAQIVGTNYLWFQIKGIKLTKK